MMSRLIPFCWLVAFPAISATTPANASPYDQNTPRRSRDYCLDSRTGADEADGTEAHPWRTLAPLKTVVFQPGDNVLFTCGSEFTGGFEVRQSGTESSPVTIRSSGKGPPPRFTNPRAAILDGNAIRISAEHVIVDGLYFSQCPQNPVDILVRKMGAVFLTTAANHCVVRNCEMTQTPIGVTVYGEHNLIAGNNIHDNNAPIKPHWGPMGVVVAGSHNEIAGNRITNYCAPSNEYGHDGGAIEINDRALPKEDLHIHHNLSLRNQGFIEFVGRVKQDNLHIHHNVCMDYQSFLGFTGPCTNIQVDHNTVVRTLAHDKADSEDVVFWSYNRDGQNSGISLRNNIFVYGGPRIELVFSRAGFDHNNNLFYRIDQSSIPAQPNPWAYERQYLGGGEQLGNSDKIGDPLFRDMSANDFRLKAGSPAIGAGAPLGYDRDFDGRPIPSKAAPDMGAFEHSAD